MQSALSRAGSIPVWGGSPRCCCTYFYFLNQYLKGLFFAHGLAKLRAVSLPVEGYHSTPVLQALLLSKYVTVLNLTCFLPGHLEKYT